MARVVMYFLELLGVGGLVMIMVYVSWTKMILGSVLAIVGAFFPTPSRDKEPEGGGAHFNLFKIALRFTGGIRFGVVCAGIVLIVGALIDGHEGYTIAQAQEAKAGLIRLKDLSHIFRTDSFLEETSTQSDDQERAAELRRKLIEQLLEQQKTQIERAKEPAKSAEPSIEGDR